MTAPITSENRCERLAFKYTNNSLHLARNYAWKFFRGHYLLTSRKILGYELE